MCSLCSFCNGFSSSRYLQYLRVSRCAAQKTSLYKSVYIMGEDRNTDSLIDSLSWDRLDEVELSQMTLIEKIKLSLKLKDFTKVSVSTFMPPRKEVVCGWVMEAVNVIKNQNDLINHMKTIVEQFKTETLSDKAKIIRLQHKLLENKDEQIRSLESSVEKTVHSTVEREIKSYSEAVSNCSTSQPVVTPEKLKHAIKSAIKEEDRSRNVIVFGLLDEEKEQVEEKVSELFADLGEKPRIQASRIGRMCADRNVNRPVKVVLANSTTAHQILLKAKKLKQIDGRKSVFISPDRSADERECRKKLVTDLKQLIIEQPNRHHFIRSGRIQSADKT